MTGFWPSRVLKKGRVVETRDEMKRESRVMWPSLLERTSNGNVECPTNAIIDEKWFGERCIFCRRCDGLFSPTEKGAGYEITSINPFFKKSLYIFPLDTGSCGSCNEELHLIFSPQYDANRFGIFMAATPRHADVIFVMGVINERMREVLERVIEATPEPKTLVLSGTCAISGGIMGEGFSGKFENIVKIFGCPPTPANIIEALIELKGGEK
ncbi:NADH-quinone oxidoreductase subunit B family protein [Caldiplasma sukawensis]